MIAVKDGLFTLETRRTGYYIGLRAGLAENLHYGARVTGFAPGPAREKLAVGYGSDVMYHNDEPALSLEHLCLELSPVQKGDYRVPSLLGQMPGGALTLDFQFAAARTLKGSVPPEGMPGAMGGEATLALDFTTPEGVLITLFYTVYPDCDVITRRMRVRNGAAGPVTLRRALSYQLDLPAGGYTLTTFTGAWAREFGCTSVPLVAGEHVFGSRTGASSQFCNPFFMLAEPGAGEDAGEVYGFNLIYSGSHTGRVEVSPFGKTRVCAGIADEGFAWTLAPGESFSTPEAVLTFSAEGKNGMSRNMHAFVRRHIVRGPWARRERPVLFNNWEATYFDFNEKKLLRLAREAAALGVELFVLDDGWFGARNSDTAGLGDYAVNRKKLPGGLGGLSRRIHTLGMRFGIWVEPEMANADSDLLRAHPDWIVATPGHTPGEGRHQFVLDLCRSEVRRYIVAQMDALLDGAPIDYVKWDMNRHVSDAFSPALREQGRFFHAYVLGLYQVLGEVVRRHPRVLFEGCSSGGNRFDLGMLCYMPQIWTSDDTDAFERRAIQAGASYGYPPSVMGCHVSASPNHQTARATPLDSRFNTAAFGVLGYELDLAALTPAEKKAVAAQIAWYKAHRRVLQFGVFRRLRPPAGDGSCAWIAVSPDGRRAVAGEFQGLVVPNSARAPFRLGGLRRELVYRMRVRPQTEDVRAFGSLINHVLPVHVNAGGVLVHLAAGRWRLPCETRVYTARGGQLMDAGVRLEQTFTGTGYNAGVRMMPDFSSRLYELRAAPEPGAAGKEKP